MYYCLKYLGILFLVSGILVSGKQIPPSSSDEIDTADIHWEDGVNLQQAKAGSLASPSRKSYSDPLKKHHQGPDINQNKVSQKTQEMLRELEELHGAKKTNSRSKRSTDSTTAQAPKTAHQNREIDEPVENIRAKILETAVKGHILGKIIDGVAAPRGKWPWSVALYGRTEIGFICGGVIIARNWVLTAAHCVASKPAEEPLYARIGAWNLTANDYVDLVPVLEVIVHEYYSLSANEAFDIALLRLIREANVNNTDDTILSLPNLLFNLFELNPNCFIIGWGVTESGSEETSDILNQRWVNVISHVECQQRWNQAITHPDVHSTNLCIDEGIQGDISACQGDSGSPLQCYDTRDHKWKLAGLSSWGSSQCNTFPSVYIRAQSFLIWIMGHLSETQSKDFGTG